MKCYKVLYRDYNDKLLSIGEAFEHPSVLIVEYKPSEWVSAPEGTGLFVFNTLGHAKLFTSKIHSNHKDNVEIWEVETKHTTERIRRVAYITVYKARLQPKNIMHAIRDHWHCTICDRFAKSNTIPAPIGTLACESVLLKRRV